MSQKKIGLALSGGGARGFAHIGVIKVLAEHNIPIDFIAGTSIGSFVGGALAAGMSAVEIDAMGQGVGWLDVTRPSFSPRALFSNAPMTRFIERNFPVQTFDDLRIPFTAVVCDLVSAKEMRLRSGDLALAIRASCAVPGIFMPIGNGDGSLLVDGGVVAPLPVDAVREMGADVVIAVDLLASGSSFRGLPRSAIGMIFSSAMTLLRAASANQNYDANVTVIPQIAHIRPDRLNQRKECRDLGEAAAREKIDEIKKLVSG